MLKLSTHRQLRNKICEAVACRFIDRLGEDKESKKENAKKKVQGTRCKKENPKSKKTRHKDQGTRGKAQEPKPDKQHPENKIVYYNSAVVVVRKVNRGFVGLFDNLHLKNNHYIRNLP